MHHYHSIDELHLSDSWLTIGTFDGVHIGHQTIIRHIVSKAREKSVPAVVFTFHPHPASILRNRQGQFYLTSPYERAEILGELGVNFVITQLFDHQFSQTSASEFISKLYNHFSMSGLGVGYDFALGRDREGDVQALSKFGKEFGYELDIIPAVDRDDVVVSSSAVRQALDEGDIDLVTMLLDRPYQVRGIVIPGDGMGRKFGIPTANLKIWEQKALPKIGVYVCTVIISGEIFGAVTNIGVRPTFDKESLETRVETHVLDFDEDLYSKEIKLNFIARLRDEQKFSNVEALIDQISMDIKRGKNILESNSHKVYELQL